MGAESYYVYGVIAGAPAGLELGPGLGPGAPVELLAAGGLSAIVSPVPLAGFSAETIEARLADLAWLEAQVRGHQDVLARALGHAALVPLRFGTVYREPAGVLAMLEEHGPRFHAALARLAGRQEWGLKITADRAALAERVAAESPRARQLAEQRRAMSAGAAYLLTKRLDQLVRDETAGAVEGCAAACHELLAGLSAEAVARGGRAGEPGEPELALSAAYLVDDGRVADFTAAAERLAARFAGFGFALSGPWPPYTFAGAPGEAAHA